MYKYPESHPQTCIGDARISERGQVSGESLNDQVSMMEKFAKEKGWKILPDGKIPKEIGSAKVRRTLYDEQIQYIKANPGKVGYYIIRYIDRFSRGGVGQYDAMKKELAELGVILVDTSGIIQPSYLMPELEALGFEYDWGHEKPSKMAETMSAVIAEDEGEKILKRTIPKQIKYTQGGYQVGCPDDGLQNKRIRIDTQLRYIQAPDPKRAHFIQKIFELRAACSHTDQQILHILNEEMGFRTKMRNRWSKDGTEIVGQIGGKKLGIKQLQRIYQRTVYAGVLNEKWTHDKPVKAQWEGLVSIELWNKANRNKLYLKEYPDGTLEMLYNYKTEKPVFQRLQYNPEYPFKCVTCPECGEQLKGSAPKGRNTHYPQYHCARGHKSFSVSRNQMDKTVEEFFSDVEYSEDYVKVLEEVLVRRLRQKQDDIVQESKTLDERVALLKSEKSSLLKKLISTESDTVSKMMEAELENKEAEIKRAESYRFTVDLTEVDVQELIGYARKIVESPEKALLNKANPLRQEHLFKLFFDGLPTYAELASGTAKKRFLFNMDCIVETPEIGVKRQKGPGSRGCSNCV
jgi:hypothetical protein